MKKMIMAFVCLMTMISANAHNTHYPTYTEDGITYVASYRDNNGNFTKWDILKIDKPYTKTIIIPREKIINGEKVEISNLRDSVFSNCVSLDSLIISDGFYLSEGAFLGCKNLEYLYYSSGSSRHIPNYKGIPYYGLHCRTLETVVGVYHDDVWGGLCGIEKLIIKENSTGIFARLRDCKNLKTIICYAVNPPKTSPTHSDYSYGGTCGCEKFASDQWDKITLYVPRESLEKYYFDGLWGEIDNIYAIDEMPSTTTSINSVSNKEMETDVWYSLNGTKVDNPTKGVYIKNGKKYNLK